MKRIHRISRRSFIKESLAAGAAFTIVPRHVFGAEGQPPPSETLGAALIGVGGRGPGTFGELTKSLQGAGFGVNKVAECDVKWVGTADNKARYTDFRRVIERKDVDVIAIATPPHWHALISIAAMEAGKDVLCEKPMTRTIGEGHAVAEASRRYGRIFQIGTFGRFSASKDPNRRLTRKILKSGLVKQSPVVYAQRAHFKVKEWSGLVNAKPQAVPPNLDWDMYCGPSPLKPYHPHRHGGTHRGYWDYENGGMGDMGQHYMDPVTWTLGKDDTAPVEVESNAPPAHHEACGMWGWVELKYADGTTIVLDSQEWGDGYDRKSSRGISASDLSEEDQKKLAAMPDPESLLTFGEAVRQRKPAGGNADAAYRTVTILHLANISIRLGRKIRFDPDKHECPGDDEANRLVNQPMRAPWHI
jgi:myo-inositol 2-dehydrogenase / D-chiro-inositol 1-dehydrogenase